MAQIHKFQETHNFPAVTINGGMRSRVLTDFSAFLSSLCLRAEFGPNAPEPNRNKAYISYIDSVQLYHTKACVLRGKDATCTTECSCPDKCKEERREIVRRVLIGYLDSVRLRGFEGLYIWAMPPNDLHHDYVFHMRPIQQHCPTPQQLDNWYTKLLNVAQEEGVISGFDSNAHKSDDPEDTSRNLPASLFGPDMSLR